MVIKALICGGGNAAHVMSAIANSQPDVEASVLTLYADEAERWTAIMAEAGGLTIVDTCGEETKERKVKPFKVTKHPEDVVPDTHIILFAVPAFAHEQYLNALKPHVQPGTVVVGIPGQPGFEFAIRGIWGSISKTVTIMNFITLPWNCRILQFGKKVEMMSLKSVLPGAMQLAKPPPNFEPKDKLQKVVGPKPVLQPQGHFVGISLSPSNPILHPSLMYGRWKDWDGTPLDAPPLFYNELTEEAANFMSASSDEVVATAKRIMQLRPQVSTFILIFLFSRHCRLSKQER